MQRLVIIYPHPVVAASAQHCAPSDYLGRGCPASSTRHIDLFRMHVKLLPMKDFYRLRNSQHVLILSQLGAACLLFVCLSKNGRVASSLCAHDLLRLREALARAL